MSMAGVRRTGMSMAGMSRKEVSRTGIKTGIKTGVASHLRRVYGAQLDVV
jgi:hypothetical protein